MRRTKIRNYTTNADRNRLMNIMRRKEGLPPVYNKRPERVGAVDTSMMMMPACCLGDEE